MAKRQPLLSPDQLSEIEQLHAGILDPIEEMAVGLLHGVQHLHHITFRQFLEGWEEGEAWGDADLFDVIRPGAEVDSVQFGVGPNVAGSLTDLMPIPDWDLTTTGGIASVFAGLLAMAWQIRGTPIDLSGSQFTVSVRGGDMDRTVVVVTHWLGSKHRDHRVAVCYDESLLVRALA